MADCACADDKQRQALGLYLRAVTLDETNVNAWLRGSEILEILGFTDNARSWQRKARELFPESLAFAGDRPWLNDLTTSTLEPSS
jgi:Flp pilus assembly protein TadD